MGPGYAGIERGKPIVNGSRVIFDCPLPAWLVGLGCAAAIAAIVVYVRRDVSHLRPLLRRLLLTLALVAGVMASGLLLSPKLIRTWPDPHKPRLAVLADASRSMALEDTLDEPTARWLAGRLPAAAGAAPEVSREQIVRALLKPGEEHWTAKLAERFELVGRRFAGDIEDLSLDEPFEVDPDGHSTAIGRVLEQAAGGSGGSRPRAVLLISDGAWNTGPDPTEVARVLGTVGIPIYTVGVGDPEPPRDAAVVSVRTPKSVLLGDEVFISAQVAATGMGATRVQVQLIEAGEVIDEKHAVTLPSGRPVNVNFSFVPQFPGRRSLIVSIPRQGAEQNEANNTAKAVVEVVERKIKLLLIDSEPRWEFRFIRNVFERDPAVEIKVCLVRPGIGAISGPNYVDSLPTEKTALAEYDLFILGDVPRGSLPDAFLEGLADVVKRRSGALIVIAGRRGNYRDLAGTPLKDILPVTLEGAAGSIRGGVPFRVELTHHGSSHLITRLAPRPEDNELEWSRLPHVMWSAEVAGLAPGARALLVHPLRLAGASKLPLLAVHRVGTGKVMFCGLEETWRWRKSIGDRYHYRFWAQTIRWMVKRPFVEGDPRSRLSVSRSDCMVGEKVEVEAYCLGADGYPLQKAQVWLQVTDSQGEAERIVMDPAPGGWGVYQATLTPSKAGALRMQPVVSIYGKEPLSSSASLEVIRPDLESSFLAQDRTTLSAIAQAGGGKYLQVHEVDRLAAELSAAVEQRFLKAEYSPCRHWLYYTVIAAVLGSAWFIRKRSGLA